MKMIANKRLTYGTRRLQAGDEFEASPRDARLLAAVSRARLVPEPQPTYPRVPPHDGISMARAEYERVFNKRPFMGWDEAMLREKIEAGPTVNEQRQAAPPAAVESAANLFKAD